MIFLTLLSDWNDALAISPKQSIFLQNVISVTPQNTAKIWDPTEVSFCSNMHRWGDICKKPLFSNFATSKGHNGHVCKFALMKIGMEHFFVLNYQSKLKNSKLVWPHWYFIIRLYFRPMYIMATPVCAQFPKKIIQKLILTCQIILRKGHEILMKNGDLFL